MRIYAPVVFGLLLATAVSNGAERKSKKAKSDGSHSDPDKGRIVRCVPWTKIIGQGNSQILPLALLRTRDIASTK